MCSLNTCFWERFLTLLSVHYRNGTNDVPKYNMHVRVKLILSDAKASRHVVRRWPYCDAGHLADIIGKCLYGQRAILVQSPLCEWITTAVSAKRVSS